MTDEEKKRKKILRMAEWRAKNPEKAGKYGIIWRKNNLERSILNNISKTYHVNLETAKIWYLKSMAECDSCGEEWNPTHKKRLFIDHNHNTGEIRGILCHHCNSALGLLKEDSTKILALLEYNRKHNGEV